MNRRQNVKFILDQYLEARRMKKTPERYAVLSAIFDFDGLFSIEELDSHLCDKYIKISRATLYSVLKIFIQARLVVRHMFPHGTFYETENKAKSYCHQVCSVCGKVSEFTDAEINSAIENSKLKRFRKEGFSLYIYGVCSTCQSRISRQMNNGKKRTDRK